MLYITTSTGTFSYTPNTQNVLQIMSNKYRLGFFKKKSKGFFGICFDKNTKQIIVASREKLGTPNAGKPTTDAGLHYINPLTQQYNTIAYVKDVHDVHQIDISGSKVLLTDTGKNRIIVYDIKACETSRVINFGKIRDDIHHINAVTVMEEQILVGLNNRGSKASEILRLPLSIIDNNGTIDNAFEHAIELIPLSNYTNTHDVEPYHSGFLFCSSHDSVVVDTATLQPVIQGNNWVRGITCDNRYIWVGQSHYAKRSKRHGKSLDGSVLKVDSNTMEILETLSIPGTGQINDLQYIHCD